LKIDAALHHVVSPAAQVEPREVVPDVEALLVEVLQVVARADPERLLEVLADDARDDRARVPLVVLVADRRLVQELVGEPGVLALRVPDAVDDVGAGLERPLLADVLDLVLVPVEAGEVDDVARGRLPVDLPEREVLLERRREVARLRVELV
jgi:hypothetical protein